MKHILIVDDNKTNLSIARMVLCEKYKVTPVTSGAQALKFLENNSCDLILLDLNMPVMNGLELMEKIKVQPDKKDIPVIILTADSDSETQTRCIEAGAVEFIAKPFVSSTMLLRIGNILELADLRRQLKG